MGAYGVYVLPIILYNLGTTEPVFDYSPISA